MEENSNLSVWAQVEETPTEHTKKSNHQGRTQTSISGTYVVKKLTEVFGVVGSGWGYQIVEERYDQGMPVIANNEVLYHEKIHTIRLSLWWKLGKESGSVEHFGHTKAMYKTKHGCYYDEEAPKKSLTDAIKKCASQLGVCADIFLGYHDDRDYVESINHMSQLKETESAIDAEQKAIDSILDWIDKESKVINSLEGNSKVRAKAYSLKKIMVKMSGYGFKDSDPVWVKTINKFNEETEG